MLELFFQGVNIDSGLIGWMGGGGRVSVALFLKALLLKNFVIYVES